MSNPSYKHRDTTVEALRLLLMVLIVLHHSIVHGMGLMGMLNGDTRPSLFSEIETPLAMTANAFCICAVNCFVFISGFYGIRTTVKRFVTFMVTFVVYNLLFNTSFYLFHHETQEAINSLLIFSHPGYWFINAYMYLMLFAPCINAVFASLPIGYRRVFIAVLLFISCYLGFVCGSARNPNGYTTIQLIMVYAIGRYVATRRLSLSREKAFWLYVGCSVAVGCGMYLLWLSGHRNWAWHVTSYNNPLVMAAAIGLFFFCKSFTWHNATVNRFAASAIAIYLIQSSRGAETCYYAFVNDLYSDVGAALWLLLPLFALAIVAACLLFDRAIRPLLERLTEIVCKAIAPLMMRLKSTQD